MDDRDAHIKFAEKLNRSIIEYDYKVVAELIKNLLHQNFNAFWIEKPRCACNKKCIHYITRGFIVTILEHQYRLHRISPDVSRARLFSDILKFYAKVIEKFRSKVLFEKFLLEIYWNLDYYSQIGYSTVMKNIVIEALEHVMKNINLESSIELAGQVPANFKIKTDSLINNKKNRIAAGGWFICWALANKYQPDSPLTLIDRNIAIVIYKFVFI